MKNLKRSLVLIFLICFITIAYNNCGSSTSTGGPPAATFQSTSIPLSAPLSIAGTESNVMSVSIGCQYTNEPCVSVTVCSPGGTIGTNACVTIPNILLDTGSSGLRLFSNTVSSLGLSAQIDPVSNNPVAECISYADGSSDWGPVMIADVALGNGNELASSVPIQVIQSNYAQIPGDCADPDTSAAANGFNGILGVNFFAQDCGDNCANDTNNRIYFNCAVNGNCSPIALADSLQVSNPVFSLANDNNGVILQLPSISTDGATSASGFLVLGIGTQTDNTPPSGVTVLPADANGNFLTQYNNVNYSNSFIDSGSNGNYFPDSSIQQCSASGAAPGFYCPTSAAATTTTSALTPLLNLIANQISSVNSQGDQIGFQVVNAETALGPSTGTVALPDLAGPVWGYFDWGLPFFFGKTVYIAGDSLNTPIGMGPYWGY